MELLERSRHNARNSISMRLTIGKPIIFWDYRPNLNLLPITLNKLKDFEIKKCKNLYNISIKDFKNYILNFIFHSIFYICKFY